MAKRSRESSFSISDSPISGNTGVEDAHTPKYFEVDQSSHVALPAIRCSLPPHEPLTFEAYAEYESHYLRYHTNRCRECRKNFPSPLFLDLHITENHDPITAARRARGEKTFACFVEHCDKICLEWQKRRSHLVDKHGFPKNYDFHIVNSGTDGRSSMLRRGIDAQGHRKSSRDRAGPEFKAPGAIEQPGSASNDPNPVQPIAKSPAGQSHDTETNHEVHDAPTDPDVEAVISSFSSLRFVPRSVTFGKRKAGSGLAKS